MSLPQATIAQIKNAIQTAQATIPNIQSEIDRLRRAGQDTSDYNTRLVNVQAQIQKLKQQYPEASN